MKKTLQTLGVAAAMTFSVQASAQLPDYGVFPAGLILDEFGTGPVYDIDSILDSGTPVIIDAFAVWCGPCWSYHTAGTLETVYNSIGQGGSGDVMIFGVEADASEPEADMDGGGSSVGDWVTGTDYPMCNDDNIANMINLAYYPTLILVCPDRTVTEVGQATAAAWTTAVNNCGVLSTDANDLRIISNETVTSLTSCGGGGTSTAFEVVIQNYSTLNVTGTKTINVMNGATVVGTANVAVNLDPYEAMLVTIPAVTLSVGANPYTTVIASADDDISNNTFSTPVTVANAANVGTGDLLLTLTMDAYAIEVGVLLASGNPYQSVQATAYANGNSGSYTGLIDFTPYNTYAGNGSGQGVTHNIAWYGLAAGCYHFIMFDDYGDGLLGSDGATGGSGTASDGIVNLKSESGYNANYSVGYGDWGTYAFEVTTAGDGGFTGVEEAANLEFASVYPNPAVDMTTVEFNLSATSNVTIQIVNTLGQVVYANAMGDVTGTQKVQVNTADLEAGIYLINISVDGNVVTKRISVVK